MTRIGIIGGGAAGCFCAIEIKRRMPDASVTVYEAGRRPLAKLSLTGGGRCNYTNTFEGTCSPSEVYPRGANLMKRALKEFGPQDTLKWFRGLGIEPVFQEDHRVFPVSQDAMQVVRALLARMEDLGVEVRCGSRVSSLEEVGSGWDIAIAGDRHYSADAVVVTTGGRGVGMLPGDIVIEKCVPSLFSLKCGDAGLKALAGTAVRGASLSLAGTKFKSSGDLLVTDWGLSGPAVLKLSSYAARHLSDSAYKGTVLVNWLGCREDEARTMIQTAAAASPARLLANVHPDEISSRLWGQLLSRAGIREDLRCGELGAKGLARLCTALTAYDCPVTGRAAFKEEFVTCGGVALSEVNPVTMECRHHKGLFFAGEVLDVDAVTGGFNLQAAWSTGWLAASGAVMMTRSDGPQV